MRVLLATIGLLPGLDGEDSLGLGYLAVHLRNNAEIALKGFVTSEGLEQLILEERPDLLFLGSFTGADSVTLDALDKAYCLNVPVVLGGPGFAVPVESVAMQHAGVCRIIFGEADAVDPILLLRSSSGAEEVGVWRQGGPLPRKPAVLIDPDSVPPPRRAALETGRATSVRLSTSRGCPFRCHYCPLPAVERSTGVGWRPRRADAIAAELDSLVKQGARHVSLADDSVTPAHRGQERMDCLASIFANAGVTFSAMVSPLSLVEATTKQMETWRKMGLVHAFLLLNNLSGLEGEQLRPEVVTVITQLRDSNIDIDPGWITIDPFMTPTQFLTRLGSLASLRPKDINSYVRPLSLLPGTIEERRYNKSKASIPARPRVKKAGINFQFVEAETARLVDAFLGLRDDLSMVQDSSVIASEISRWATLSKA